jgi:putative tryptophan/tyrosine transport system substrate-binding protein
MKRRSLTLLLIAFVMVARGIIAEAQQTKKVARLGFLISSTASFNLPRFNAFRQGLHDLGYIEGQNITIEYRYAEGKLDRLPDLAAELVRLKVDLIIATADGAVRATKRATKTIPIIFVGVSDPVGQGFVTSLARPGGNATGFGIFQGELSGKRLELLAEAFPKIFRLALLFASGSEKYMKEQRLAAEALGIRLVSLPVTRLDDIEAAFVTVIKESGDALLTNPSPMFASARERIVDFAAKNRLPAMYYGSEFVDAGGLMSYGPNFTDMYRRAAMYADKILRGRKPADLPVEQPTKFELVINLKTAKEIGLTIPPNVLSRADRVIK